MKVLRAMSLAAVTAFAAGCDNTTGITVDDLVGTWNATKFEYTSAASSAIKFDMIQNGGGLTITVSAGGAYSGTVTLPGGLGTDNISGTFTIVDDTTLTRAETGETPENYNFSLVGDTFTFTDTTEEFDFDFDGVDEDATLTVVLVRQ